MKTKMPERLCLFCEHLNKEHQMRGSEWTGDYGKEGFSCAKNHFDEYGDGDAKELEEMRVLFLRAKRCSDYSQPYLQSKSGLEDHQT